MKTIPNEYRQSGRYINDELSDLFFNHRHLNYDDLHHGKGNVVRLAPTREQIEAAILEDAREFVATYPSIMEVYGLDVTAYDLAANFMYRL